MKTLPHKIIVAAAASVAALTAQAAGAAPAADPFKTFALLANEPTGGYARALLKQAKLPPHARRLTMLQTDSFSRCRSDKPVAQDGSYDPAAFALAAFALSAAPAGARDYQPLFIEQAGDQTLLLTDGSPLALVIGTSVALLDRGSHAVTPLKPAVGQTYQPCLATALKVTDPMAAFTLAPLTADVAPLPAGVTAVPDATVAAMIAQLTAVRAGPDKDPFSTTRFPLVLVSDLLTKGTGPLLRQTIGAQTLYVKRGQDFALLLDRKANTAQLTRRTVETVLTGPPQADLNPLLLQILAPDAKAMTAKRPAPRAPTAKPVRKP